MRRFLRRYSLALVCLAAAGLVGTAAVVDHHVKSARTSRAELAEWYCEHLGTRCGGASAVGIEARWNQREVGYVVAVTLLGATGAGLFVAGSFSRRASGTVRQPPV